MFDYIIQGGTNDIVRNRDEKIITEDLVKAHKIILEKNDLVHSIVVTIPPASWNSGIMEETRLKINHQLRLFVKKHSRLVLLDLAETNEFKEYKSDSIFWSSDGIHFSPQGKIVHTI